MPLTAELLRKYKADTFVETGTFMGRGVEAALEAGFVDVRSVEVSEELYRANGARFDRNPAVKLYLGPSEQRLEEMIRDIRGRIVFWLDAHFSGENTGMSHQICPLLDELDIIARHPVRDHTILIDDVRLFGTYLPGVSVDILQKRALAINPAYEFSFEDGVEKNDVMVCRVKAAIDRTVSGAAPAGGGAPVSLSVIMSVHNGEKYLSEAVRSVLAQTTYDFELVAVNDASTDTSESILRSFNDPRIRIVVNPQNLGLTKSLNVAGRSARGEFIARMDADDISLPHRFQKQVDFLRAHPDCAMVGSSYYVIDAAGAIVSLVPVVCDPDQIRARLLEQNWFGHGSVMLRRAVFEETGGYDERFLYAQDYDYWLRLSEKYRLANIEEPLYCWRRTAECISEKKRVMQRQYSEMAHDLAVERRARGAAGAEKGGAFDNAAAAAPRAPGPSVASVTEVMDFERPLVSVIVPTFNRPVMVVEAVKSILAQTFQDFEIVVVNDAGEDVEPHLRGLDPRGRIVYVRNDRNRGLAFSRNQGIRVARGTYIAYLDDDDRFYPPHLATLVAALKSGEYDVAYTDAYTALQSKIEGAYVTTQRVLAYSNDFSMDRLLVNNLFPVLCVMHKRSCVEKTGLFDVSMTTHEDWELWIRMAQHYRFVHVPAVTAEFSQRPDQTNMTTTKLPDYLRTRQTVYARYRHLVEDKAHLLADQEEFLRCFRNHCVKTIVDKIHAHAYDEAREFYRQCKDDIRPLPQFEKVKLLIDALGLGGDTPAPGVRQVSPAGTRTVRKALQGDTLRVLLQNRPRTFEDAGGDTTVVRELREHLPALGVTVEYSEEADCDLSDFDVVHLFNLTVPQYTEAYAGNAARQGVPFVVTSLQEDMARYLSAALACLEMFKKYIADGQVRSSFAAERAALRQPRERLQATSTFAAVNAGAILACAETEVSFLKGIYPDAPVRVLPFGADSLHADAPAELFCDRFGVRDFVLCVGRLDQRKNQLMLLKALEDDDVPVVFVDGDPGASLGGYRRMCRDFKRKGCTILTGRISEELLVSAYHAAAVHCLPSWYELPGLATLEAALHGCPVVASSWGAVGDYLGDTCTYCEPDDPEGIRAAVLGVMQAGRASSRATERAAAFTWEKYAAGVVEQYRRVLAAPRPMGEETYYLDVSSFAERVVALIETDRRAEALAFYEKHRPDFGSVPELVKFDALMDKARRDLHAAPEA